MPHILKIVIAKQKRRICSCLATVDQAGQKNRNGKAIVVLFCKDFYY
jgi:hypothetical protein